MILNNQKGAAMIVALMVLLVVALLGTALWQYSSTDRLQVFRDEKRMQAYYIARAGADATRSKINTILGLIVWENDQPVVLRNTNNDFFENGNFEVVTTIEKIKDSETNLDIGKKVKILSTGTVQDVSETVEINIDIMSGVLPSESSSVFPSTVEEDDWLNGSNKNDTAEPNWVEVSNPKDTTGRIKSDLGSYLAVGFPENLVVEHQEGQQSFNLHAENFWFKNDTISLWIKQGNILNLHSDTIVFEGTVELDGPHDKNFGVVGLYTSTNSGYGKVYFYKDVVNQGGQQIVPKGAYYFKNGVELWGKPNVTPALGTGLIPIEDTGNSDTTWK
ncbi:hypothetical protein JCM14036_34040 [Desulfotomaculum defluvii]